MKCINCKQKSFDKIISLGSQPLSCKFPKFKKTIIKKYKLNLVKCNSCGLVQLDELVNPKEMYGEEYGYYSGISPMMKKHLNKIVKDHLSYIKNNSYILDIGSNDGTLLNAFFKYNKSLNLVGVDPNIKLFSDKYKKNIKKIPKLFDQNITEDLNPYQIKFDLIFSIAMFYDISDPNSFIKLVKSLLSKNGIWVVELSYFKLLLENMTFDQICHEHIAYYNLIDLSKILKKHKLKIFNAKLNEINGGSIQVSISKSDSKYRISPNFKKLISEEKRGNDLNSFVSRVYSSKNTIYEVLKKLSKNNIIYGYGASTKGNIILNFLKINNKIVRKICDANKFKLNRYTPGSKIQIISKEQMRKEKPDYLFVLIWSFRREVIYQEKEYLKSGGKLIIPYPSMHIIDKNNYKFFISRDLEDFAYKK
tara:strand:+ start:3233 stop:4492 length:1260 start_codon:yes stop_codon:yes gene_type:complete